MKYIFLTLTLVISCIPAEAQFRPVNSGMDSIAISDLYFVILTDSGKDAVRIGVGTWKEQYTTTPFFCTLENKVNKRSVRPVLFRLGNKDYTDMLERKDINKAITGPLH